jgi:uncharacterized protein YjbJ (UPF0337 family)
MSGKFDQAKGRLKEATGSLTGDDELKGEGKTDRLGGEIKEKAGEVKEKVEDLVDKAKDKLQNMTDRS